MTNTTQTKTSSTSYPPMGALGRPHLARLERSNKSGILVITTENPSLLELKFTAITPPNSSIFKRILR